MYNKLIVVGNLTKDIEIKYTQSNLTIASTGIATNKKFKNQMGQEKEEVMFLDITFFGRTAEIANQYLKKGSQILVDGRLKLDQWTDTSGQKRSKHSLVVESMKMLGSRETTPESHYATSQSNTTHQTMQQQTKKDPVELTFKEEDCPF